LNGRLSGGDDHALRQNAKLKYAFAVGLFFSLVLCASVWGQTPYYAGKTITIVRGGGPGGSGEFQSRALMPYLRKYIPGNPTITMEFMNGAL
jgi:hypothetical protein